MIVTDGDNRMIVHYRHELDGAENHKAACQAFRDKLKWKGKMYGGHVKDGMVWVFACEDTVIV
jgi:hypothetical protein